MRFFFKGAFRDSYLSDMWISELSQNVPRCFCMSNHGDYFLCPFAAFLSFYSCFVVEGKEDFTLCTDQTPHEGYSTVVYPLNKMVF